MKRKATALLLAATAILAALSVVGGGLLSGAMSAEERARRVAEETRLALGDATALLIQMLNAETGQRGYLLTGEEGYLEPFNGRELLIAGLVDDLRLQTAGEGAGTQVAPHVDRLEELIDDRFALLDAGIAARRDGRAADAVEIVRSGGGRAIMDAIRAEIDAIRAIEETRLAAAYADAERRRRATGRALAALFGLGIVILGLAAVLGRRAARAEAGARYIAEVRAQRDRADLIRRELSHRVKNLFAVINSIITTTARGETDAREAARKTRERVQALARAHALSTGATDMHSARLDDLVAAIVLPYAPPDRPPQLSGPPLMLPAEKVTPVGLILNELATNALKYGCWSHPDGTLSVDWALTPATAPDGSDGHGLTLHWTEQVPGFDPVTAAVGDRGFGTQMIDLSVTQADARLTRDWTETGLRVTLTLDAQAARQQKEPRSG